MPIEAFWAMHMFFVCSLTLLATFCGDRNRKVCSYRKTPDYQNALKAHSAGRDLVLMVAMPGSAFLGRDDDTVWWSDVGYDVGEDAYYAYRYPPSRIGDILLLPNGTGEYHGKVCVNWYPQRHYEAEGFRKTHRHR